MRITYLIPKIKYFSRQKYNNGYRKKELKNIYGFTLIEMIIVIAMFAVTGTLILSILLATLRASNKSDRLLILKQVGNPALSQVVKQIRYAKSLDAPAACPPLPGVSVPSITISSITDSAQTILSCQGGSPATIASNGASLINTEAVDVSECSFVCYQINSNEAPTINFSFKLNSKNSNNLVETTGSIRFQTSVVMRNYNK